MQNGASHDVVRGFDQRRLSDYLLLSWSLKLPVTAALYCSLSMLVKQITAFRRIEPERGVSRQVVSHSARSARRATVRGEDSLLRT
jgi:hypothetical protein